MGKRSDLFFFFFLNHWWQKLFELSRMYTFREWEWRISFFEITSMWKYMIGSVSRWIAVLMCLSVCESLRNQGEQEAIWVLGMESCPQVWNRIVELRCQGPHQLVYASSVCTGPFLFGIRAGCVVEANIELVTIKVIWDVRIMSSPSGEEIPEELLT